MDNSFTAVLARLPNKGMGLPIIDQYSAVRQQLRMEAVADENYRRWLKLEEAKERESR